MTSIRDRFDRILHNREVLTEEQTHLLSDVLGDPNGGRFDLHAGAQPSKVMVLLILALVEHIERLEARIERMEKR